MDSVIELKCPQCGANLVYNAAHKKASCEYCGYEMLVKNEQEEKRKQMAENDQNNASLNELAAHLLSFGSGFRNFRWRVKNVLWFLFWSLISLAACVLVCKYLPAVGVRGLATYRMYQMVVGVVLCLVGIFSMVTSHHRMRGIPLGIGLGLLISYFMNFWS